jgi:hypothetical protein
MFEIAPGRFINLKKVIGANAYEKNGKWRVAFTMDTVNKEAETMYSAEFTAYEPAKALIQSLPS